ncbi:MAG: 30S ribosome-binding factor RbfA [Bacteroidaceae bacterium]|nr:30S ribosome-binding factor RbfA [Bacteroidaceae bacterium]
MESTRQNKIARLIQKDLSNIFQAQTRQTRGILVSVSVVRVSPDLSVAKAYLSIFPSAKAEEIITNINAQAAQIRFELGNLERHQLRIIPELKFFIDDSLDYIENIDNLLKKKPE